MNCHNPECDEAAALEILITGETTTRTFCMQHGQDEKQRLDSNLRPYTSTSIVRTDPSQQELLADSYGKLEQVHTENLGLRKSVTRLETALNISDQDRQRLAIDLDRKSALVEELTTQIIAASAQLDQVKAQLASADELLESLGAERGDAVGTTEHHRVEGGQV